LVTVLSDIDILVAVPRTLGNEELKRLPADILLRAIEVYGLPWDAPVEVHVADARTLELYLKTFRKAIKVDHAGLSCRRPGST